MHLPRCELVAVFVWARWISRVRSPMRVKDLPAYCDSPGTAQKAEP